MSDTARLDSLPAMRSRLFWLIVLSCAWGVGFGLWTVWLVVQTVHDCLPGSVVSLDLPLQFILPPHAGTLHYYGSAYVLQNTDVLLTRGTMSVSHLPVHNVILLGLGKIFASATSSGIAWCIYFLVRKLRANEPFTDSTARALVTTGLILGIGSSASTISTSLGELGLSVAYNPKWGDWPVVINSDVFIQFTPLFFAGVLFALAGVFRYGSRLEQRRRALERETEGLV